MQMKKDAKEEGVKEREKDTIVRDAFKEETDNGAEAGR